MFFLYLLISKCLSNNPMPKWASGADGVDGVDGDEGG